jgi:hypothetical protein
MFLIRSVEGSTPENSLGSYTSISGNGNKLYSSSVFSICYVVHISSWFTHRSCYKIKTTTETLSYNAAYDRFHIELT